MPPDPRTAAPGAICPPIPDLPGGQATVAGFADIDGIPGESVAIGHRDEIDIVTLHWCVTNETGPGGGGGGAGRAVLDGVVIGLEDVASPRVNVGWPGGLPDEEISLGFGKVCWEYRRSPSASPVRFCFDLRSVRQPVSS
jgi:type VI protein secretion system component Hcp